MRVPIYLVIPLCLVVVGGVWWTGTRDRDFLKPPSEEELAIIREKVIVPLPPADHPDDADEATEMPQQTESPVSPPAHPVDALPNLADYRDLALKDAASLVELARQLETRRELRKSLLAWERVLDSTAPDEARALEALQAIKRLRAGLPEWNANAAAAVPITIHAGSGKTTAALLLPVLEAIARDLEQASSGILKVTSSVAVGQDIPEHQGPVPIALWLAGSDAGSPSTEVFAFTFGASENLHDEVVKTLFKLIRRHLGRAASLTVPEAITPVERPMELMQTHVTRLGWRELGAELNKTLE